MGRPKDEWGWPDVRTGECAASSGRMDAGDVDGEDGVDAFETWNSMTRRGNEDAASDVVDVNMERGFACWNSGYQRDEEGLDTGMMDASARRAFELWDSGRTSAAEGKPLAELEGGQERMSEAVERLCESLQEGGSKLEDGVCGPQMVAFLWDRSVPTPGVTSFSDWFKGLPGWVKKKVVKLPWWAKAGAGGAAFLALRGYVEGLLRLAPMMKPGAELARRRAVCLSNLEYIVVRGRIYEFSDEKHPELGEVLCRENADTRGLEVWNPKAAAWTSVEVAPNRRSEGGQ
jgi:hypothetical protein